MRRNCVSDWRSSSIRLAHAYYGEYPLAYAAAFGYTEIYDFLIENGADPNMQDSYGNTVLHMLVIRDLSVRVETAGLNRRRSSSFRTCSITPFDIR